MPTPADLPLTWITPVGARTTGGRVRYQGPLAGADRPLSLHLGFDGAGPPFEAVPMERADDGTWTAEIPDAAGHVVLDCAVATDGFDWDNNATANYRLWLDLDPVDAHVHARVRGLEPMGFDSLRVALASGGMTHGLVSWQDNRFVDEVADGVPWLTRLVWVSPGGPGVDDVRRRLADGAVGLKLHPSYDDYPADSPGLDPFLRVAAEAGVPVTVHTAPGPSDPDLVRRLAERHPDVPFVLYHTFLGLPEGRRRAARHAQQLPNLHLETSWCGSAEVERLIGEVGPDRVLFGSDAAVDGPAHFVRTPPNIELSENYNGSLLRLARRLPPETLRALLEDNTRQLFRLPAPRRAEAVPSVPEGADPLVLLGDALEQAERVVAAVRPEQLRLPTPCTDWDVQELLGHLTAVARRAERVAAGRPHTTVPAVVAPDARRGWAPRFAGDAAKARAAWADGPADVLAPWGRLPAPVALSGFVLEVVAHTHDLAVSTAYAQPLDPRLADAALRAAERLVPADLRGDGSAFADPVPTSSADAYARLAAFLGRAWP
ncbi:TIGR03086 family metal-binding protein [Geodermatophilus sp. URMC 64]